MNTVKKQEISKITCRTHNCHYLLEDGEYKCPYGHNLDKRYFLVRYVEGGSGWSEWGYTWTNEIDYESGEIVLTVSEEIYKAIITEQGD